MNFTQALEIVQDVCDDMNQPLLETLMYMQCNLADYDDRDRAAFRVVFNEMRKLFVKE